MNPFDPMPNAWAEAAIFIGCLVFLGYALWVLWPALVCLWLMATW